MGCHVAVWMKTNFEPLQSNRTCCLAEDLPACWMELQVKRRFKRLEGSFMQTNCEQQQQQQQH
eukprot:3652236-Amphidinium_carterae.1